MDKPNMDVITPSLGLIKDNARNLEYLVRLSVFYYRKRKAFLKHFHETVDIFHYVLLLTIIVFISGVIADAIMSLDLFRQSEASPIFNVARFQKFLFEDR